MVYNKFDYHPAVICVVPECNRNRYGRTRNTGAQWVLGLVGRVPRRSQRLYSVIQGR